VLGVAEELLGVFALHVAPQGEVVALVRWRERGGLEDPCGSDVVHATGCCHGLCVAPVQVHAVAVDRVLPDRQGVDAGQHRPRHEVERVFDAHAERQVGGARPLPPSVQPLPGELVADCLADVEHVEVAGVVEPEALAAFGPVDIE
jgi:hypothetical protein